MRIKLLKKHKSILNLWSDNCEFKKQTSLMPVDASYISIETNPLCHDFYQREPDRPESFSCEGCPFDKFRITKGIYAWLTDYRYINQIGCTTWIDKHIKNKKFYIALPKGWICIREKDKDKAMEQLKKLSEIVKRKVSFE